MNDRTNRHHGRTPLGFNFTWGKTEPQWTTEPPTQEGWYWVHGGSWDAPDLAFYDWTYGRNERYLVVCEGIERHSADEITHWIGPLPVPEPPTD